MGAECLLIMYSHFSSELVSLHSDPTTNYRFDAPQAKCCVIELAASKAHFRKSSTEVTSSVTRRCQGMSMKTRPLGTRSPGRIFLSFVQDTSDSDNPPTLQERYHGIFPSSDPKGSGINWCCYSSVRTHTLTFCYSINDEMKFRFFKFILHCFLSPGTLR